jgi:hypothetical protein
MLTTPADLSQMSVRDVRIDVDLSILNVFADSYYAGDPAARQAARTRNIFAVYGGELLAEFGEGPLGWWSAVLEELKTPGVPVRGRHAC